MGEPRQDGRPPYSGLRFDGTNFDSWQFGVKLAVQSEESWGIVNGTEPKPNPIIDPAHAGVIQNAAAISGWERRNTMAMRIIYSSIKEEKSRPLMSCISAQEMWTKMETAYSVSAAERTPLLWSQFYGCKFLPGQTVMEFMAEIDHIVSRLRAINGIVLLDDQITAKVILSLPPSLKLNFKTAWESTAEADRTLRNLTTRLVQLEREIKQREAGDD